METPDPADLRDASNVLLTAGCEHVAVWLAWLSGQPTENSQVVAAVVEEVQRGNVKPAHVPRIGRIDPE